MKPFWVSFWIHEDELSKFEYNGPWWISGEDMRSRTSIVAAVMAESPEDAQEVIIAAHDDKKVPDEWRFVEERESDWNPLANKSGRFESDVWMKWPWPLAANS